MAEKTSRLSAEQEAEIKKEIDAVFKQYIELQNTCFNTTLAVEPVMDFKGAYTINGVDGYLRVKDEKFRSIQSIRDFVETICAGGHTEQLMNQLVGGERPLLVEKDGVLYELPFDGPMYSGSYEFLTVECEENQVTVSYILYGFEKEVDTAGTLTFVKENGKWKVEKVNRRYPVPSDINM